MRSTFGKNIKVSIWGGSHEPSIGVDIEGLPVGTSIDREELEAFLKEELPVTVRLQRKERKRIFRFR